MGISRLPLHEFDLSCCRKDPHLAASVLGCTGDSAFVEDDFEVKAVWRIIFYRI